MKKTIKFLSLLTVTASVLLLTGCGNNQKSSKEDSKKTSITSSKESAKDDEKADLDYLRSLNALAGKGTGTELTIKSKDFVYFKVGKSEKIKPGIYDLTAGPEIALISRHRKTSKPGGREAWGVSSPEFSSGEQKNIRLILEEGDTLGAMPMISSREVKVKLTPAKQKRSGLKIVNTGDFIVGRDLEAGEYEVSTNSEPKDKISIESCQISIYNHRDNKARSFKIDKRKTKKIKLYDGEVMTVIHTGFRTEGKTDTDSLLLTPLD